MHTGLIQVGDLTFSNKERQLRGVFFYRSRFRARARQRNFDQFRLQGIQQPLLVNRETTANTRRVVL